MSNISSPWPCKPDDQIKHFFNKIDSFFHKRINTGTVGMLLYWLSHRHVRLALIQKICIIPERQSSIWGPLTLVPRMAIITGYREIWASKTGTPRHFLWSAFRNASVFTQEGYKSRRIVLPDGCQYETITYPVPSPEACLALKGTRVHCAKQCLSLMGQD